MTNPAAAPQTKNTQSGDQPQDPSSEVTQGCLCAEPEHETCWVAEPNPDCSCCQQTLDSIDDNNA